MKLRSWVFLALSILYFFCRYQNCPGVFQKDGIQFNDTDPYYRLHRIERMLNEHLIQPLHDDWLSFPQGFDVPWPTGLDLTLAIPLRLFGITDRPTLESFSALAIPLLAFPTFIFVFEVTFFLFGLTPAMAVGLLYAMAPTDIYASAVGRLDHHFLEALFTALLLLLTAHLIVRPGRTIKTLLVATLVIPSLFWPQAWVLSIFLGLALLLAPRESKRSAPKIYFLAAIGSAFALLFFGPFFSTSVSITGFSWWAPLLQLSIATFFTLITTRGHQWIAILLLPLLFVLFRPLEQALTALRATTGLLSSTTETLSPFTFPWLVLPKLGLLPYFLALVAGLKLLQNKPLHWLAGFSFFPLLLLGFQARFAPLASPVLILLSVHLLYTWCQQWLTPKRIQLIFPILVFSVAAPTLPSFSLTHIGNHDPLFVPTREAALFLKERNQPGAIAAPWDVSNWFLYYAQMPVVADGFQSGASLETMKLYTSESDGDLETYLHRHPIRYLVAEAPSSRMNGWITSVGKDLSRYVTPEGPTAAFHRLFLDRLFSRNASDKANAFLTDWQEIYVSPHPFFAQPSVPTLKIFERVRR